VCILPYECSSELFETRKRSKGTDCRCGCKNDLYHEGTWRQSRETEIECGTTLADDSYGEKTEEQIGLQCSWWEQVDLYWYCKDAIVAVEAVTLMVIKCGICLIYVTRIQDKIWVWQACDIGRMSPCLGVSRPAEEWQQQMKVTSCTRWSGELIEYAKCCY